MCKLIIFHNENNSFDIIKNNTYDNLVLLIIAQDGNSLNFVSTHLKNNKNIVLKGITQNKNALKFASNDLKNDKELVLKAVCKME